MSDTTHRQREIIGPMLFGLLLPWLRGFTPDSLPGGMQPPLHQPYPIEPTQ